VLRLPQVAGASTCNVLACSLQQSQMPAATPRQHEIGT
jgi:hypothetical protein